MKRILSMVLLLAVLVGAAGCASGGDTGTTQTTPEPQGAMVAQEEYDTLLAQYESLSTEFNDLSAEYETVRDERNQLKNQWGTLEKEKSRLEKKYNELSAEYEQFKTDAEPFMQLSEAEREAEIARAKQEKAEAEEAARLAQEEAQRKKEEQAAAAEAERLAQEAKGYDTGITFKDLSRSPDNYIGKKVTFTGVVLQIIEGDTHNEGRMSTSGSYNDVIYIYYTADLLDVRLLEDDEITIYGTFYDMVTYETVIGGSVTLPMIVVDRIDLHE